MSELVEQVKAAGVIGAGGAGFPTHVKLSSAQPVIIVNGAECEPLIYSDLYVMENLTEKMLLGLRLVMMEFSSKLDTPVEAFICVKRKNKQAIATIESGIAKDSNINVFELDNVYPSGDEQYLVYEVTGKVVPEGGIPPMVGALVTNVATLCQVADASASKPVTERYVTIGGEVENAGMLNLPIGTSFGAIVKWAKPSIDDYVLLVNGPMMGRLTTDLAEVTTKTMGGLFALPKGHSHVYRMGRPISTEIKLSKAACEVCRYCTDFCPRYLQGHALEPHKIMRVINYDRDLDTKTITSAWLCCECGVCDIWACPMFLSPRVIFKEFKLKLADAGINNPHSQSDVPPDLYRQFRGVPTDRLVRRMDLVKWDKRPPLANSLPKIKQVVIKLNQHIGAPAKAVVKVGAKVGKGELIADIPKGTMGATYHASIAGKVTAMDNNEITIEA